LSTLAHVLVMFLRFGTLFLLPIYLQTLRHETAWQAGAIQGAQALATLLILPIAGRLADKIGPKWMVVGGLLVLAGAMALMGTLTLETALWAVVGMLALLGCAYGLTQQTPVAAMSCIEKEAHKEVANGSTLLTVLQSTAAPLGVAMVSSFVSARSQQYSLHLGMQGISGELLHLQSSLLAMHEAFVISSFLALVALLTMCFVPGRRNKVEKI
jgi:MFS family permease